MNNIENIATTKYEIINVLLEINKGSLIHFTLLPNLTFLDSLLQLLELNINNTGYYKVIVLISKSDLNRVQEELNYTKCLFFNNSTDIENYINTFTEATFTFNCYN